MPSITCGPWVGEFGWELFCWQAQLRHRFERAQGLEVICYTRPGHGLLYEDFAQVRYFEPGSYADTWKWVTKEPPAFEFPAQDISRKPGKFIRFGKASEEKSYDFLFHARERWHNRPSDNWLRSNWYELAEKLPGKKACVGTFRQAAALSGCDDLRGVPLAELADYLASSSVIVGPTSGPMHFATLCGCPQVVWSAYPRSRQRYEKLWNPFAVQASVIESSSPTVLEVEELL